jgi:protein-S-isoprenylcysteine O-methyltransferase Ste14
MYLGMAMLLTAWSLWLGELSALVFVLLFMLYLQIFQIKPEERLLSELFGEPYLHYLQEARRWL